MWKLKDNVKIVLKRHRVVVDQKSLAANQNLAHLITEDPKYNSDYGHNLVWTGDNAPNKKTANPNANIEISVNVKKKPKEEETKSEPTSSTLTEAQTDGKPSSGNAGKQESALSDSPESKQKQPEKVVQETGSRKRK